MSDWPGRGIRIALKGSRAATRRAAANAATASAAEPDLAPIRAAIEARDFARAARLAHAAVAAGARHPTLLNLAAVHAEGEGRRSDALDLLRQASAAAPEDPGVGNALGLILLRLGRDEEALRIFTGLVSRHPDVAGAHCGRGRACEALGRLVEAEAAYAAALAIEPDNLAALQGRANLLSRRGAHAQATPLAERVLAAEPNFPDAVMVLASADAAMGQLRRAAQRLELLLDDTRLTAELRALAHGQLGDVLDASGQTAAAFEAYSRCNTALEDVHRADFGGEPSAAAFARGLVTAVEKLPATAWRPPPDAAPRVDPGPARRHVFLLGFPRSGTTLLEQVLDRHPDVAVLSERPTLVDAERRFLMAPDGVDALARTPDRDLDALRQAYWSRVADEGADVSGRTFVDKHPLNTFRLPLILRLFPEARVLAARRDPRDVVLSCFRRRFAMSAPAYQMLTVEGCAIYYDAAMRMLRAMAPAMAGRRLDVRHEALVADFDAVLADVLSFLDLAPVEGLRHVEAGLAAAGVATPSGVQLAKGLNAEGIGAWRRYAAFLRPAAPWVRDWVRDFDYPAA